VSAEGVLWRSVFRSRVFAGKVNLHDREKECGGVSVPVGVLNLCDREYGVLNLYKLGVSVPTGAIKLHIWGHSSHRDSCMTRVIVPAGLLNLHDQGHCSHGVTQPARPGSLFPPGYLHDQGHCSHGVTQPASPGVIVPTVPWWYSTCTTGAIVSTGVLA
jgi:hypothetical protein